MGKVRRSLSSEQMKNLRQSAHPPAGARAAPLRLWRAAEDQRVIKLNTNENPYPPSPKVLAAVKAAVDGRLRLYPNPTAQALREKLAKLHGCQRGQHHRRQRLGRVAGAGDASFCGAGSEGELHESQIKNRQGSQLALRNRPILHAELFALSGAGRHSWRAKNPVPLKPDFSLPSLAELKRGRNLEISTRR